VNHGHRNNYDPLAANFHSRVDYWCAVSPSNSCPLRSAEVERYLVVRTGLGQLVTAVDPILKKYVVHRLKSDSWNAVCHMRVHLQVSAQQT
jgi:hypothetical protein